MALTRIKADTIADGAITTDKIAAGAVTAEKAQGGSLGSSGPKISNVEITDNSYTVLDDTAVDLAGGYIKITGSGFAAGCSVIINDTAATATTFVSESEVRAQVPAKTAGTYFVYVVNSDGGTATRVNGLTYSASPVWVTSSALANANSGDAYSQQLSATGASTYSLASGSTLPSGLTLSSGGLLSGTITVETTTNYSFTIVATDLENQDSPRTFNLLVTVIATPGQIAYTTAGTYSWTAPANVTSVSVVCVGGGACQNGNNTVGGAGGGGLGWKNNISVTPGQSYTVVVGKGGANFGNGEAGGDSYFINASTVKGGGGSISVTGGTYVGDGGGNGGNGGATGSYGGGGGAGGYAGTGGTGGTNTNAGTAGSGGGGGGGKGGGLGFGYAGGGVGILGQGTNGTAGTTNAGGGGSGGEAGTSTSFGGNYGGGGGNSRGGSGAVRIIWGAGRAFPSTNTADV